MFNSLKALKTGCLDDVNDDMLFPLLRWCSGSITDLAWCSEVNKNFFFLPKYIQKTYLAIGLRDKSLYVKYPKASKEQVSKSLDLKKELAKQYYKWSDQELARNVSVLDCIDWLQVLKALGSESKDYKTLGIKEPKIIPKPAKKELTKKPVRSLLDF